MKLNKSELKCGQVIISIGFGFEEYKYVIKPKKSKSIDQMIKRICKALHAKQVIGEIRTNKEPTTAKFEEVAISIHDGFVEYKYIIEPDIRYILHPKSLDRIMKRICKSLHAKQVIGEIRTDDEFEITDKERVELKLKAMTQDIENTRAKEIKDAIRVKPIITNKERIELKLEAMTQDIQYIRALVTKNLQNIKKKPSFIKE